MLQHTTTSATTWFGVIFLLVLAQFGQSTDVFLKGAGSTGFIRLINQWLHHYQVLGETELTATTDIEPSCDLTSTNRLKRGDNSSLLFVSRLKWPENENYPWLKSFPIAAEAIVLTFNVPGVSRLVLSIDVAVDIFLGRIVVWNHTDINQLNPSLTLPDEKIFIIARMKDSCDTYKFTNFLSHASKFWKSTYGGFKESKLQTEVGSTTKWPVGLISFWAINDQTVCDIVHSIPYSISYLSSGSNSFGYCTSNIITWKTDSKKLPNVNSILSSMEDHMKEMNVGDFSLNAEEMSEKCPFCSFFYLTINIDTDEANRCDDVEFFYQLISWSQISEAGRTITRKLKLIPLPTQLTEYVVENVYHYWKCKGNLLIDSVNKPLTGLSGQKLLISTVGIIIVASFITLGIIYLLLKKLIKRKVSDSTWIIPELEVTFGSNVSVIRSDQMLKSSTTISNQKASTNGNADKCSIIGNGDPEKIEILHLPTVEELEEFEAGSKEHNVDNDDSDESSRSSISERPETPATNRPLFYGIKPAHWTGQPVVLYRSGSSIDPNNFSLSTFRRISDIRRHIIHDNVWNFLGVTSFKMSVYHMYNLGGKGALHQLLAHSRYDLDLNIKYNLASDVCEGLAYLHRHNIVHGFLDTWNCVLDYKWTVKIGNWGQCFIAQLENDRRSLTTTRPMLQKFTDDNDMKRFLYRHPDLLSGSLQERDCQPRHDLYSLGMVLIEIFTREIPYSESTLLISWKEILGKVAKTGMPPALSSGIPSVLKGIIQSLMGDKQTVSLEHLLKRLEGNKPSRKGIVDTLMVSMEEYMNHLEEKVEERTGELRQVSERMQELLNRMLPSEVALKLQNGQNVEPEYYDSVTIYFSDIVSFTSLCSESSPLEVVNLLNALYIFFDTVIARYSVYKVETIGDAYMCVSGLPQPNGMKHAEQICRMAVAIRKGMESFVIPHRPGRNLSIRIGVHSGSVMAGVVGIMMPRYCLFGDTVNTTSRMESTSVPNRIQASYATADILIAEFPEFHIEARGEIDVKGKGSTLTYWIHDVEQSENEVIKPARPASRSRKKRRSHPPSPDFSRPR